MTRHNVLRIFLPRILITLCLIEVITACSSTAHPTLSTNPVTAQKPSLLQPNVEKARALDRTGLFHIEINPVFCGPFIAPNAIVLASNRLEYDDGEIRQMATYIQQIFARGLQLMQTGNSLYDDPPAPPATLNVALGGLTGPYIASRSICFVNLQITNIGNSAMQITEVNVRLLSDTQLNQYQYRLIDSCSLELWLCGSIGGGSTAYNYSFDLSSAKAGTLFSGQLQRNQPLLEPAQVALIHLYFQSSENFIYSVAPEITVALLDEQRTFTLTQLTSTLAFAKRDQFSCYKLHSNIFTQEDISTSWGWCI